MAQSLSWSEAFWKYSMRALILPRVLVVWSSWVKRWVKETIWRLAVGCWPLAKACIWKFI